jgi:hypothetical protein
MWAAVNILESIGVVMSKLDFPASFAVPVNSSITDARKPVRVITFTGWGRHDYFMSVDVSTELLRDSPVTVAAVLNRRWQKAAL